MLSHLTGLVIKFLRIILKSGLWLYSSRHCILFSFSRGHEHTAFILNFLHLVQLYQVSALGFSGYRLHCSMFILLPGLVQVGLCSSESKEFIWKWFGSHYLYNYPFVLFCFFRMFFNSLMVIYPSL